FANAGECGSIHCKDLNYREHFHCLKCDLKVFVKKEEMIRHFKWHKKRDESLQHGFMRYANCDDCSDKFPDCQHNRKQTHYHCMKSACDKVYISTSDVQMHASYHRKEDAILKEGFQRFRGAEDCQLESCPFNGQKTTHFHCRRLNCNYTFKNKADMEKHKSYHIKDEQLNRDGFKKFMKHESCTFENCKFSKSSNHIHCIRQASHKKRHERKETELAYRKYRLAQNMIRSLSDTGSVHDNSNHDDDNSRGLPMDPDTFATQLPVNQIGAIPLDAIIGIIPEHIFMQTFKRDHIMQEEAVKLIFEEPAEGTTCTKECILYQKEKHYHCRMVSVSFLLYCIQNAFSFQQFGCAFVIPISNTSFKCLQHYKMHEEQQRKMAAATELNFNNFSCESPQQSLETPTLQHPLTQTYPTGTTLTSIDGYPVFKRKRGRPPKNRTEIQEPVMPNFSFSKSDIPVSTPSVPLPLSLPHFGFAAALYGNHHIPLPISQAFGGLPPSEGLIPIPILPQAKLETKDGFYVFQENVVCRDQNCIFFRRRHYHCCQPRCFYVTDRDDCLIQHSKDFHDSVIILEGFAFFDRTVDCGYSHCRSNRMNRHYHCTRKDCGYSFVKYMEMSEHEEKHRNECSNSCSANSDNEETGGRSYPSGNASQASCAYSDEEYCNNSRKSPNNSKCERSTVVKAAGTFYPLSGFSSNNRSNSVNSSKLSEDDSDKEESKESKFDALHKLLKEGKHPLVMDPIRSMFSSGNDRNHHQYGPSNGCGRPFCKLKKRDHFHCNFCNQSTLVG
ncbi:hypothetical protein B4U80_00982, partial [Leptotrombidium deliense]